MINFLQQGNNKKEVLLLIARFFDVQRNQNFNAFQKIFAKQKPIGLGKCHFEQYLGDGVYHRKVLLILDTYLEERKKGKTN